MNSLRNPRPIRPYGPLAGIGIGFGAHPLVRVVTAAVFAALPGTLENRYQYETEIGVLAPFVVMGPALIVGIIQLVRGDRGIGVGLLLGGAVIPFVLITFLFVMLIMALRAFS